jgi:hypothetical protein
LYGIDILGIKDFAHYHSTLKIVTQLFANNNFKIGYVEGSQHLLIIVAYIARPKTIKTSRK